MSIKLTEDQLAGIFQHNSKQHTADCTPADCLSAMPASDARMQKVEALANDHTAAQAMKAAISLREWSQIMAQSIENSRRSWFSILGMNAPLKTAVATVAFAMALVVALPEFESAADFQEATLSHAVMQNDLITEIRFDTNNDQLMHGGFDANNDQLMQGDFDAAPSKSGQDDLFNGSFG